MRGLCNYWDLGTLLVYLVALESGFPFVLCYCIIGRPRVSLAPSGIEIMLRLGHYVISRHE